MTDGPQQPHDPQQGWPPRPVSRQPQFPRQAGFQPGPARPAEPDWSALAEDAEEQARKRKRVFMIAGGVLAVAAVGGIVATAVVSSSGKKPTVTASGEPSATESQLPPEPSFSSVAPPPPPEPLDFISDPEKDTAPITADTLFPGKKLEWTDGRTYTKTNSTSAKSCANGAKSGLATALTANGCRQLVRATYVIDDSAVTVGIAVFDSTAAAAELKKQSKFLLPLSGGGIGGFCQNVACWARSGTVGRYAYFTIAGPKNGQAATSADKASQQAGVDTFNFAFRQIAQRGKDQAAASVASPTAYPTG